MRKTVTKADISSLMKKYTESCSIDVSSYILRLFGFLDSISPTVLDSHSTYSYLGLRTMDRHNNPYLMDLYLRMYI